MHKCSILGPLSTAAQGKGASGLLRRGWAISTRYGVTAAKMELALAHFLDLLEEYGCSATFPITSTALSRNAGIVKRWQWRGVEFAIHGYIHVDYSALPLGVQMDHLERARHTFAQHGVQVSGFRCPYLRWNADILTAIQQQGLAYESSQSLAWDVVDGHATPAYWRGLDFYGSAPAERYPSLPHLHADAGLVRIPYSLPDDEALVERLTIETSQQMADIWLAILRRSYARGELFTLGLHPERIAACQEALSAVLSEARALSPGVWVARLDEIATWWRERAQATAQITDLGDGSFHLDIAGPDGANVLVRLLETDAPAVAWGQGYQQVQASRFSVRAACRPCIGVAPGAAPALAAFLRQQGYLLETSRQGHGYAYYFDQTHFGAEDERPLLAHIEETSQPLVRLGRWPNGAQSALAITGDLDALTVWDYALRIIGK